MKKLLTIILLFAGLVASTASANIQSPDVDVGYEKTDLVTTSIDTPSISYTQEVTFHCTVNSYESLQPDSVYNTFAVHEELFGVNSSSIDRTNHRTALKQTFNVSSCLHDNYTHYFAHPYLITAACGTNYYIRYSFHTPISTLT